MLRVAQVLYSGLGGHGGVAFSLARATNEYGWRHSMAFVGIEPVLPAYRAACGRDSLAFQSVSTRRGAAWLSWPGVYRALTNLRPDAIVMHSVKTIIPCALYARRHRVPLLAVEHQANALKRRSEWLVSGLVMRLASGVVVLTEEYRDQLRDRLGRAWRESKVEVIPSGVDTEAFAPRPRKDRASNKTVVGMAARFTSIKYQALLVDAIALLCDRDGHDAWRLSLAGDGDTLPALAQHITKQGLDEVVTLHGNLDEAGMQAWFQELDIYAHASAGETLSTSLLQAMAMGLPIVGSAVPGIEGLLAQGDGVGLAVPQSATAFADAFTRLRADRGLRKSFGTRARRLAEDRYSMKAMAAGYAGHLRSCTR